MKSKAILFILLVSLLLSPAVSAQDTVSSASVAVDQDSLVKAMGPEGSWIIIIQQDLTVDQDLVLAGEFKNRGEVAREVALYTSAEDHSPKARFTLTAPKLTIKSPNATLAAGTFIGDIYVEAEGFSLEKGFTVDGNIHFANNAAKESFTAGDNVTITGSVD